MSCGAPKYPVELLQGATAPPQEPASALSPFVGDLTGAEPLPPASSPSPATELPESRRAEFLEVLGPGAPPRTMNSTVDGTVLGQGEFALLQNFRLGYRCLETRYGTSSAINANGIASGTVLGELDTETYSFRAIADGGTTKLYYRNGSSWDEFTAGSGHHGSTRFSSTTARVRFAIIRSPMMPGMNEFSDPADTYLVAQNGLERARIICLRSDALANDDVAIVASVDPPRISSAVAKPILSKFFTITASSGVSAATSDADITAAITTGTYGKFIDISFLTTVDDGDNATITFNSIATTNDPTQFHMVYQGSLDSPWDKIKVSLITSTGTEYVIHDPAQASSVPIVGFASGKAADPNQSYQQVAFDLGRVWSSGSPAAFPTGNYNRIKFTWVGDPLATALPLKIYAAGFGGQIQYGADFGITYFCGQPDPTTSPYREGGGSRSESALTPCTLARTQTLGEVGGTPIPGIHLAEQAGFRYRFQISYPNPPTLSATSPITHLLIYGRFVGSSQMTLANWDPPQVGKYSGGSWVYESGDANTILTETINSERITPRKAPSTFQLPIPIGTEMIYNGGRLAIANARFDTTDTGVGQVAFSVEGEPFRFSYRVTSDDGYINPDSSTIARTENETIEALVPGSNSPLGAENILIFTRRGLYSTDNSDALNLSVLRYLGPHGTLSPKSVVVHEGNIIWLDSNRQVRMMGSEYDIISRGVIEKNLLDIPVARLPFVAACVFEDRLHLAVTPASGSTNINVLVYDFRMQGWTLDVKPHDIIGWQAPYRSNQLQLWSINADRTTSRHEDTSATTDSGTAIAHAITGATFMGGLNESVVVGEMAVRTTATSATITTTRTMSDGTTVSGTITLAASGTPFQRDTKSPDYTSSFSGSARPIASDPAIKWSLSGNLGVGKKILQVLVEFAQISGGANV